MGYDAGLSSQKSGLDSRWGCFMSLIFVDVEANGISPASGVMTEFGAVDHKSRATFHGKLWDSKPDPSNPAISLPTTKVVESEKTVMERFAKWLEGFNGRPIFVSDNPAYDFQWINFYFDKTLGKNPFGHSGRRISDFWAGLNGDWSNTQKWKRYRITPHDHNPVHDAMGNVEAFDKIMDLVKAKPGKILR